MTSPTKTLGVMKPLGGGDPIPLAKEELLLGRRPTCDVRLDFENISGKHCQLRFVNGVWHVRDLHSTNGTTVNGQLIHSEHGVMPDDELGIAGHLFLIDYDPVAPTSLLDANQILEEEIAGEGDAPRRRSLMEMAGLSSGDAESSYRRSRGIGAMTPAPERGPRPIQRPEEAESAPIPVKRLEPEPEGPQISDDDFLALIRQEVQESGQHQPVVKKPRKPETGA
jgi:hypothetical protein